MTLQEHAYHLGGLFTNLQSLEFLLRIFLSQIPGAAPPDIPPGQDIYSVPVGGVVPENPLTNYDSLGKLIGKYNLIANAKNDVEIDPSLVEIRDALAHGRVSAPMMSDSLRLLKFSKPHAGHVTVTFNVHLSEPWFSEQKRRTREAMFVVAARLNPPATPVTAP